MSDQTESHFIQRPTRCSHTLNEEAAVRIASTRRRWICHVAVSGRAFQSIGAPVDSGSTVGYDVASQ